MSSNASIYQQYTDKELIAHYLLTNREEWLNALFKRYSILVYGVCMKYLKNESNAQDATQQVFEKCIHELKKYDVTYFKSWLYQITKNYCLMQLRKKAEFSSDNINVFEKLNTTDETEQEQKQILVEKDVTLDVLHQSLAELQTEQQQCIQLFYLEKKSYQQISELLNFNYLQVKSFIQNGKRNLKILVEKRLKDIKKK